GLGALPGLGGLAEGDVVDAAGVGGVIGLYAEVGGVAFDEGDGDVVGVVELDDVVPDVLGVLAGVGALGFGGGPVGVAAGVEHLLRAGGAGEHRLDGADVGGPLRAGQVG